MSEQSGVVFLRGERVVLRPLSKTDLPYILRWINDPEVRHFVSNFLPRMESFEEKWLERVSNDTDSATFMIEVASQPIGTMGIHAISWKDRRGTTGALIGEKEYWGKGYGSEAKRLLLEYAFNTLNLRKVCSLVIEYNIRSYKYSLKCGYKEEGRLKTHQFADGKYWDLIQLAIFDHEWREINK